MEINLPTSTGHCESNGIRHAAVQMKYSHTWTMTAPNRKRYGQPEEQRKALVAFGGFLDSMVGWSRKSRCACNSCSGSCCFECDPGSVPGAPETPASERLSCPPRVSGLSWGFSEAAPGLLLKAAHFKHQLMPFLLPPQPRGNSISIPGISSHSSPWSAIPGGTWWLRLCESPKMGMCLHELSN